MKTTKFEKFSKKPTLNKNLLKKVKGGEQPIPKNYGYFYTLSGECNGGHSCWDIHTWGL